MRSLNPVRTTVAVGWQVLFVLFSGVVLASLVVQGSVLLVAGAVVALLFCIGFLQRPDLGLLFVLLVRASTDATLGMVSRAVGSDYGALAPLLSPNAALILVVILGGGLFVLSRNVPLIRLPGGKLLTLLLLTGLVGMLRSDEVMFSFGEWLPVVSALIVYGLTVYLFRTRERIQKVVDVLAASFVLPAAFGFYQLLAGRGFVIREQGIIRIYGTFVGPNAFGLYLVLILSVFLAQALFHKGRRKILALLIAVAAGTLLLGTFARAPWVGALVVLLTVGALRSRILLIFLPLTALVAAGAVPAIGARLQDPLGGSFAHRLLLWGSILKEWIADTGAEPNSVSIALNRLAGLGPGSAEALSVRGFASRFPAHNDYIRVLVEYGVFGLVLYLALFLVLAIFAFQVWRRASDRIGASIALSFLGLTLAYPIMAITDVIFAATRIEIYFWTLAGLAVAASRLAVREGSSG